MIRYDATRTSLFHPETATNFFHPDPSCTPGSFLNNRAALCAEMSRLAYVNQTLLGQYLARIGFELKAAYDEPRVGTQGFLAHNPDARLTVLAFRGTQPNEHADLFVDLRFLKTPWKDHHGNPLGEVHSGFADALTPLLATINRDVSTLPKESLLITGHSLGAALATLMASYLGYGELYTFGSPRVGDSPFVQSMSGIRHERYVDCCDAVTRIPPQALGYEHAGTLKYIDRNGQFPAGPSAGSIAQDRLVGCGCYIVRYAFLFGTVISRELADHAPINYVSASLGMRDPRDDCP